MQQGLKTLSLWLAFSCLEARAGPSLPPGGPPAQLTKALYTLSNLSPNAVIALPLNDDGTVSAAVTSTSTGGNGGAFLEADGVTPVPVDSLNSQDAIVVIGNVIYAVNAGSNTISALSIDPFDPTKLELISAPTQLEGEFPISIAASDELRTVCVATAGAKNGVECFRAEYEYLQPDGLGLRSFGLVSQTPPLMKAANVADIFFSTDLSFLYATVRSGPGVANGYLNVYPVSEGIVGQTAVKSVSDQVKVPFGGFDYPFSPNHVFASDAAFGAIAWEIAADGSATVVGTGNTNPAVKATCWAEFSAHTDSAWVTSPISNTLAQFDVTTAAVLSETNITNANGGLIDIVIPGAYLYGLAAGSSNGTQALIAVVDLGDGSKVAPSTVQQFTIGLGVNNYAHGLAYYDGGNTWQHWKQ